MVCRLGTARGHAPEGVDAPQASLPARGHAADSVLAHVGHEESVVVCVPGIYIYSIHVLYATDKKLKTKKMFVGQGQKRVIMF